LLVVLAQLLVTDPTGQIVLSLTSWIFWGVFVAEFLLRAHIARFQARFSPKTGGRLFFCWSRFYVSSARYSPYGSCASHDLAQCSRQEFEDHDPQRSYSRTGLPGCSQ